MTEFYAHPRMADGRLNKCKTCCKSQQRARARKLSKDWRWTVSEMERHRLKSRKARLEGRATIETPEQAKNRMERYRVAHHERVSAHRKVKNAILTKKLIPKSCEYCGKKKVQAHHPDYTKPLDVRWLCVKHHAQVHVEERIKLLKAA